MTIIGAVLLGPAVVAAFVAADAVWLAIRRQVGLQMARWERKGGSRRLL